MQDQGNINDSQAFMGALVALTHCAKAKGEQDLFLTLLMHWITPPEYRSSQSVMMSPGPEKYQERFANFIQTAKDFARNDFETACLNAIQVRRSGLDLAPTNYLMGRF